MKYRVKTACAVTLLCMAACATAGLSKAKTRVAKVLIPTEQENKLGLQVKQQLETQEHITYYADTAVVDYVRRVADKVIMQGRRERSDVQWQVNVIDAPKTVNAFATPGGYLYVYTGLLLAADNEAELAGVMAHETGHVVGRHSARQMVDAYGLAAVSGIIFGKNPGLLAQVTSQVASKGVMLANSRSDETEADEYGARYASAAGYDPRALMTFFGKLKALEGNTPGVLAILSDHPTSAARIAHLKQYIATQRLRGTNTGVDAYTTIKQRLSAPTRQRAM
ncbi:MAG: M48 family metallopeptidase [Polyangiales bacterium]